MRERPSAELKIIRTMDMFFFVVISVSYVGFLIFMFVGNMHWALEEALPFPGTGDTLVQQQRSKHEF
jgi:hypothetical protein